MLFCHVAFGFHALTLECTNNEEKGRQLHHQTSCTYTRIDIKRYFTEVGQYGCYNSLVMVCSVNVACVVVLFVLLEHV